MFRFTCLTLFFFLLSAPCEAQITISESRLSDRLDVTYREILYETNLGIGGQLQELIAAAGADQLWNFADLNYVDSTVTFQLLELTESSDPLLQDERLADATHRLSIVSPPIAGGLTDTSFQAQYLTFNNGDFRIKGAITIFDDDGNGQRDTFFAFYDPDFLLVRFPLEFGEEFHDSTGRVSEFLGFPLPAITELDSNFIDGWGTLVTPEGEGPALRISNKNVSRVPGLPTDEITTALEFVTAEGRDEATINLEDEWAFYRKSRPVDGVSSVRNGLPTALPDFKLVSIFPHPAGPESQVSFELARPMEITLSLHGLDGTGIKVTHEGYFGTGHHQLPLQVDNLPRGTYLLRMRNGRTSVERLIILTH